MIDPLSLLFVVLMIGADIGGLGYLIKDGLAERKKWHRSKELMCVLVPWGDIDETLK